MRDDGGNASPRRERSARRRTLLVATLLVAVSWMIYRPDRMRPFYVVDFSEFIPLLQSGHGFFDSSRSVFEYYASQGRFNAVPYVLLSLKWHLFSWWSPGWQVSRALLMVVLFGLTYVLLRRLGASRPGGLTGASVYLWAPSAADGWVHLTMAEPIGAAMMLALAIRALRFQSTPRWKREVALFAVGSVALIWSKELLAPLLLLPLSLALSVQSNGSFGLPQVSRRNLTLITTVVIACCFALVPVLLLYLNAGEAAYASIYGQEAQSLSEVTAIWITALAPFDMVVMSPNIAWTLALLGFTSLVSFGWSAGFRGDSYDSRARWLLALALVVPLAGVLVYIPSPWYARFYTLPYLIGPAILSGMAVTFLQSADRLRTLAVVGSVTFVLQAMLSAATLASQTDAIQRRDARLIEFVADSITGDSVDFATTHVPPYEWLGMGSSLYRFAAATGRPWPVLRHISCDDARRASQSRGHTIVVDLDSRCSLPGENLHVIAVPFKRIDVARARVVVDTVHADIIVPRTIEQPAASAR